MLNPVVSRKSLVYSIVAILVIGVAAAVGALLLTRPEAATAQQRPASSGLVVRTVPVGIGPISSSLGYAGAVQATRQINIVSRGQGVVTDVLVDVGSVVRRGDTLAVLDQGALPAQLLQAQSGMLSARAKLAQLQAGARPEDIQAAEAQLTAAQMRMLALQQGRPEDIQSALAALDAANARLSVAVRGAADDARQAAQSAADADLAAVAAAQAALDNFVGTSASDLQAAQSAVESSKAALAAAQASLENLRGTNAADLQAAQGAVEADQAELAKAEAALNSLKGTSAADLQAAQSTVTADIALVRAAQAAQDQSTNPTEVQLLLAKADVAAASASVDSARSSRTALDRPGQQSPCFSGGDACEAAKTSADAAIASARQKLEAAEASLAQLESGGSPASKADLESKLIQALEKLKTDQAKLDAARGSVQSAQAAAQSALIAAQQKLKTDQAKLDALKSGTFQSQQAAAQNTLIAAQQKLKADEAKLKAIQNGTLAAQQAQLESALEAATQKLVADQAKLDVVSAGPTDEDLRQARSAVQQAQQTLSKALRPGSEMELAQQQAVIDQMLAQLEVRRTPFTDADVQAAVAAVAQAEAQVALAQANLDQTTIVAPFDGIISQRLLGPGAFATPQSPIMVLASGAVEIHVTVEEARLAQVRAGQTVQLTVPAYPGLVIPARVTNVAPAGDARAHTFDARIEPDTQDQRLLPGMYAQVQVIAAQKPDAILVPREAVVQQGLRNIVFVNDNGRASARQVELGMTDDKSSEIVSGLSAGEQIVVVGQAALRDGAAIQVVEAPAPAGQPGGQGQQGQAGQGQPQGKPNQGQPKP